MSHTNGVYGTRVAIAPRRTARNMAIIWDEETLSMLADSDTVWVPTLVTAMKSARMWRYDDEVLRPIIVRQRTWYVLRLQRR